MPEDNHTEKLYRRTKEWYEYAFEGGKRVEKGYGWPENEIDKEDLELIKQYADKKNSCLEIGFGDGRNLNALLGIFKEVAGVDISENARKETAKKFEKPKLIAANILDYNPKERFDLIFEWSVITHTPPELLGQYARKINSLLKPGGMYLVVVFSAKDPQCPKSKSKIKDGQYWNFFSEQDMERLFPNFRLKAAKTSILKLKRKSPVFKNKTSYIMDHFLLQKN